LSPVLIFRELDIEKAEKVVALERARKLEEERVERYSDVAQSTARVLEMVQDFRGRNQALGITNARLRKWVASYILQTSLLRAVIYFGFDYFNLKFRELENEKAENAAYFETIRGLEEKLRTESERFQTQYALAQKAEAARSQLVHDYHSLES
jgi:hypothetical protein